MNDINGRAYAKLSELNPNTIVQVDGDFTCMKRWTTKTVVYSEDGLYLVCSRRHYLEGQLAPDGDSLIGIYLT